MLILDEPPKPSRGVRGPDMEPGNPEAYARLFAHYAPRVKGYMLRRGFAPDAAEELAQEVMLAVWKKAESFDPQRAAFSTWVFTIARNRSIDHLRRGARPEPDPDDPCWIEGMSIPSGPEDDTIAKRRRQRLRAALANLDAGQRHALRHVYFEGRTNAEAAEALGVPVGTIKSRTRRALEALRKHLGGGFDHA